MDKNKIEEISSSMVKRYSDRYHQLGYNVKTLGWGSEEQQNYRFKQAVEGLGDLDLKSILDIGCGFGDLLKYLVSINNVPAFYTGLDINPDLIAECKKLWFTAREKTDFKVSNLANPELNYKADIVLMLGLLNLNFYNKVDNYAYSFQLIRSAFNYTNNVLIVDFISRHSVDDYPKEDFIFYHDPSKMLDFALTLSSKVELRHNYLPIPQREFMLYIFK